ncbi:MAG: hypothetical protein PSY14_00050 [bacterium]|nr:hypothetical protein [bacterium]
MTGDHKHGLFAGHNHGYGHRDDGYGSPYNSRYRTAVPERPPLPYEGSLKEVFNAAVKEAVIQYPQLKGTFLFVNAGEMTMNSDVDLRRSGFRDENDLQKFAGQMVREAEGGSAFATKIAQLGLHVMTYNPLPFRLFTTKDQPYEMEAMATFYHELGHLVAPAAFGSPTEGLAENVADVFAILRHIQKYGEDSKAIEMGSWGRAWRFVLTGQGDHFTTLSIDAMPKLLEKLDVQALTPAETAALSARVALQNTPHIEVMATVARNFQEVKRIIARTGDLEAALKKMAEITLSDDHERAETYFTFRIGSSALQRFLDGKVGFDVETQKMLFGQQVSRDTTPIKLEGRYWDDVRDRMAERRAQLANEGVLLGMPHLKDPRAPKAANANIEPPKPPKKSGWNLFGND